MRRVNLITYVALFARAGYYRFIVLVVKPAVGGWCDRISRTRAGSCLCLVFSIVYKWNNKFVRLDFSADTDIRILNRSFPPSSVLLAP